MASTSRIRIRQKKDRDLSTRHMVQFPQESDWKEVWHRITVIAKERKVIVGQVVLDALQREIERWKEEQKK